MPYPPFKFSNSVALRPMLFFFPRKSLHINSKRNNIKTNNNQNNTNKKELKHTINKTQINIDKKKLPFSHSNPPIPQKNLLKSLHPRPLSRSPQNHFPKTQVHLLSNTLAFSFKRQRVLPETLRGFLPNASAFWRQIQLFRPISPHFLLQIHPNTRFYTGSIPSTSLLRGVTHSHTRKNAKFRSSERKQNFAFQILYSAKSRRLRQSDFPVQYISQYFSHS